MSFRVVTRCRLECNCNDACSLERPLEGINLTRNFLSLFENTKHRGTAGEVVIKDKTHKLSTHHLRFKAKAERFWKISSSLFSFRMVGREHQQQQLKTIHCGRKARVEIQRRNRIYSTKKVREVGSVGGEGGRICVVYAEKM